MKIQIINGPNLNLLGKREKEVYGDVTFEKYLKLLNDHFQDYTIEYFQSNIEGEIIDKIHETGFSFDGIILNAGGYTHTSIAIADAIASVNTPVIEVHISNIFAREEFRKSTLLASKCMGTISGFGLDSYRLAIESLRVFKK
ncbi:MAG TPA: type II 3-dehydroquinate dehydratase [Bacteroidales bacterium]|nr:type II 3-dehydroquinate dehydratase [Bacteroidales bacterium]